MSFSLNHLEQIVVLYEIFWIDLKRSAKKLKLGYTKCFWELKISLGDFHLKWNANLKPWIILDDSYKKSLKNGSYWCSDQFDTSDPHPMMRYLCGSRLVALHRCFLYTFFYRQIDFSSEPGVANEILENEPKSCLTVA